MVRAANLSAVYDDEERQPTELVVLLNATAPSPRATAAEPEAEWRGEFAVATAFLTNSAGGAACYDLNLSLVAEVALTEGVVEALALMKRSMTFADAASWAVAGTDSVGHTATVVASLTFDGKAQLQEVVLGIDASAARPIIAVTVKALVAVGEDDPTRGSCSSLSGAGGQAVCASFTAHTSRCDADARSWAHDHSSSHIRVDWRGV